MFKIMVALSIFHIYDNLMGLFSIHHNYQIITRISNADCSEYRFRSFGTRCPCDRLAHDNSLAYTHGFSFRPSTTGQRRSQAAIRGDATDILWIRTAAAKLDSNGPFHRETIGSVYHPALAKWVLFPNGHRIIGPRFTHKRTFESPLPYSRHLVRKISHPLPHIISGNDADQTTIPTTKPKAPLEVGKHITGLNLPSRLYCRRHLHFPLPPVHKAIPASSAHNILRRHSLRVLDHRILKIEYNPAIAAHAMPWDSQPKSSNCLDATDLNQALGGTLQSAHKPDIDSPLPIGAASIPSRKSRGPIAETTVITPLITKRRIYRKAPIISKTKRKDGAFFLINLLLFALIVYLGFNAYQTILYARSSNAHTLPLGPSVNQSSEISSRKPPSLKGYRAIWQKDLFHAATVQNLKRQETFSIDDVPYAQKDLGLVLIGTIASDDPELNRAIISNRTNKQQVAYREGENVGEVQIKKILLGKVIISTEDGNQLLTVEHKTGHRKRIAGEDDMDLEEDSLSELQTWKKQRLSRRQRKTRSRNLNRGDN